jgi:hypothetical protein
MPLIDGYISPSQEKKGGCYPGQSNRRAKNCLRLILEHGQSAGNGEQPGSGRNREKGFLKVDIARARTRIENGAARAP